MIIAENAMTDAADSLRYVSIFSILSLIFAPPKGEANAFAPSAAESRACA